MAENKCETMDDFVGIISRLKADKKITDDEVGILIEKGYLCPSELSGRDVGRCINQLLSQEGLTGHEAAVRLVEIIRKKVEIHIIKKDWAERMFEELPADCVKEAIPIIEDELEIENKISAISVVEGADYGIESGNLKVILSAIKITT